ncbi:MAG: NTP transferase domain-containing protein [Desulfurococcales archaeon]|nr:NTP transferase domain-containing protein [Desulfurococcales archaeon]
MFVSAVILAAGMSTRFPGNKMVYKVSINGEAVPLIRYLVRKFLMSGVVDDVVVVVGHEKEAIIDAVGDLDVKFVFNPDYRVGMSSSVKVGVASVMKYSDIVLIHPGDVFFIRRETITFLVNYALKLAGTTLRFVVIPKYGVKGGHPLIVGKELLADVLNIREESRGLKGFLSNARKYIKYVDVDDVGVLADVDTLEDLKRNIRLLVRDIP